MKPVLAGSSVRNYRPLYFIMVSVVNAAALLGFLSAALAGTDSIESKAGTIEVVVETSGTVGVPPSVKPDSKDMPAALPVAEEEEEKAAPVKEKGHKKEKKNKKAENDEENANAAISSEVEVTRPSAIMVENEPPARPQSGIFAAKYLFEIQAEEITRFMAVYYDYSQNVEVGPIRSARHYFVDLSTMFDAVYVHVGGSPLGLEEIKNGGINNINAIKGDRGFYRTSERHIPHNLYLKLPNLRKEIIRKKYNVSTSVKPPFEFYPAKKGPDELKAEGLIGSGVKKIHIPYFKSYRVTYVWDAKEARFGRLYNDSPFRDYRTSQQVMADNVVIMRCHMHIIDEQMRHDMDLNEGGTCEIAVGGYLMTGTWTRDQRGVLKFFDQGAKPIMFNPGNIIIHVIPPKQSVVVDDTINLSYENGEKKSSGKSGGGKSRKGSKKSGSGSKSEESETDGKNFLE